MKREHSGQVMGRRLSRRGMLRVSALTVAAGAGLALVGCSGDDEESEAPRSATAQPGGAVDQQTQRRRGAGLTAWDRDRAYEGYTLFAPLSGDGTFYLVDMSGAVVHTWSMPHPPGLYGYLLPNGNLFYIGLVPTGDAPTFVFKGGIMMEVDRDGKALWQFEHPDQHHDARLLPNGNLLLLCSEVTPPEVAARVPNGVPVEGSDDRMWSDYVLETTRKGETVWEWHSWEHLTPEDYPMNSQDLRNEWTHGNGIDEMPDGSVVISFRHVNTVAIIDRQTGELSWQLGADQVAQQHNPSVLPNGNILIFDNGANRHNVQIPFSRVIEVDPKTSEIVWMYRDSPPWNFFSPLISGAQRLANGNTLITEGNFGRLFEVTAQGEVVWEYISPFFAPWGFAGDTNQIFRAYRYAADEVANLVS